VHLLPFRSSRQMEQWKVDSSNEESSAELL